MRCSVHIRPAAPVDVPAISALMAPEIAAGKLLPRVVDPAEFWVAVTRAGIVGAVALSPWSASVVELGSLVSSAPGRGVGSALVRAATEAAFERGFGRVVALTGIPDWFVRAGFSLVSATPWARARGCATLPVPADLDEAIGAKARRCGVCPRLADCGQALLAMDRVAELQAAA